MENGAGWRRVAIALVFVGLAAAVGAAAFHFGMTQGFAAGIVEGGKALVEQPNSAAGAAAAATPGAGPMVPYAWAWGYPGHYWGHGGFFFPFLGFVFLFLLLRMVFWHRHGHGHWHRGWHHRYDGVPPHFEEWHRRAHERQSSEDKGSQDKPIHS
jgi:hypothetical protein